MAVICKVTFKEEGRFVLSVTLAFGVRRGYSLQNAGRVTVTSAMSYSGLCRPLVTPRSRQLPEASAPEDSVGSIVEQDDDVSSMSL